MDLGNPVDIVVYYLLIEGMTYLGYPNGFLMVHVLVYVMHNWNIIPWTLTKELN